MAGGLGNVRGVQQIDQEVYRSPFAPELPFAGEIPDIAIPRKDRAEAGARAAAMKALKPIQQIAFSSIAPTPQALLQAQENAAKRTAYMGDKIRNQQAKAISRYEERQQNRFVENRDKAAGRNLRKLGARKERFAGQRMKNFAANLGMDRDIFRVLRV